MPVFPGKFQYLDAGGGALMSGPCQLTFDAEKCILTPASGAPLVFDLGDVDRAEPGELDLRLTLYTGRIVHLRQFGSMFSCMSDGLIAAWRDRTVRCMLLEDLQEVMRCTGTAALGPNPSVKAEVRLFQSNIAVLPMAGMPFQVRLAEVDSIAFDEGDYGLTLRTAAGRLRIGKLARKTDELLDKTRRCLDELRTQSGRSLHELFPYLGPDRLQRVLEIMREGRSARLSAMAEVDAKLPDVLVKHAVDARLRPYFDALKAKSAAGALMAGFKFIRENEAEEEEQAAEEEAPAEEAQDVGDAAEDQPEESEEEKQPLFFWFFFPIAGKDMVAWEASTGSGRATYFFRVAPGEQVEDAVARLTRGLALVNFRREPVYLPDGALEGQPRYHRYAIGARKLPDLRDLRASFVGRAMHSSVEKWSAQVQAILNGRTSRG
jgi:hypothetical protein